MPLAQAPSVGYDLLILSFVGGFALATLIFWPMLHRAHHSRAQPAPTGKHALRRPTRSGATAVTSTSPAKSSRGERAASTAESGSATAIATEPTQEPAVVEVPRQPTSSDRFREHHAAQFDHTRSRLAKLRAELSEQYS